MDKFAVFEEDEKGLKNYSLLLDVCDNLEDARVSKAYHELKRNEPVFIALYDKYISGNYNYID